MDWERAGENLVKHKPTGTFYIRAKVAGKVIRRSLDTKTLRVAKLRRDTMLGDLRVRSGKFTRTRSLSRYGALRGEPGKGVQHHAMP